ncbi:type II CAAX endopeptidase family protein [Microbacterium sp. SL62]|uniref:CPBP family intramembrane glutamic endopeptidase n=1 Tax=Microbacterium sp. SL62 TaxID=2995139 RepID=UPI002274EE36|nr:type II CAAX endopeptidase family protein [Microbacterium sp. SL62]MCY1718560.1 type II CAAX endopeptidase family protein [Microbacterium sp. SL62]
MPEREATTSSHALRGWGKTIVVVLAALAAYVASALAVTLITGDGILGAAVSNIATAVLALLYRRRVTGTFRPPALSARARTAEFWLAAGAGLVACWLFGQAAASWVYSSWGSEGFDAVNAARFAGPAALVLLTGVLLAPLGEEALMRGIVFSALRRHWSLPVAAVASSAVFAVLHGNLVQIVLTLPLGVLLAYVYEGTQRLSPVVLMHVAFNAAASFTPPSFVAAITNPIVCVMLALLTVLSIIMLSPKASARM